MFQPRVWIVFGLQDRIRGRIIEVKNELLMEVSEKVGKIPDEGQLSSKNNSLPLAISHLFFARIYVSSAELLRAEFLRKDNTRMFLCPIP